MAASIIGCSDDLLPLILIHLPPKILLRFKLVSKQWNFIISDPQFAINHSRKNSHLSAPSGLFLYDSTDTLSVPFLRNPTDSVPPLPLTFLDQLLPQDLFYDYYPRVFQSCNGLMLCVFFNNNVYMVNAKSVCVICNPTTRGFRVLPKPPDLGTNEWFDGLTLVFNPSESHHYKVVCIKRSSEMHPFGRSSSDLYIYSSETNLWKFHLSSINPIEPTLRFQRGVFSNGAVFWMGWNNTYYYNVKSNENNNNNVGVLEVPGPVVALPYACYTKIKYFAQSCGRLFYVVAVRDPRPAYYIYELDSMGMKWLDCRVLSWSDLFGDYTTIYRTSVVAVSRREDDNWDLVFSVTMSFINRLIIANSAIGKRVKKCDVRDIYMLCSCEYVPSLVPV